MNDQLNSLNSGFNVSNHRFLNMIANSIAELIAKNVPGLKLQYTGKSVSGNSISAVLIGEVQLVNENDVDRASDKVRTVMQGLKNPTNLIEAIK